MAASAKSSAEYCDVGLGLKMQQQQQQVAGGSGASSWNTNNSNNHFAGDDNHASKFAHPRTTTTFANPSANYFNNAGAASTGMGNGPLRFTAAQWQELERQTMIYKFMLASVPVPPELLIPISRNVSNVAASHSNRAIEYGYSTNGSDPEPWRCRRTDGKKWRCSRDVAPDQKYCERHAHKNRPRSRKPVELQAQLNDKSNSSSKKTHTLDASNKSSKQRSNFLNQAAADHQLNPYRSLASAISSYSPPRCSADWFIKGPQTTTTVSDSSQDWQQMMQSNVELERAETNYFSDLSGYNQRVEDPMSGSLGTHFGDGPNDQCSLLLGPRLGTMGRGGANLDHAGTPRDFIDAWSAADHTNNKRAASTGKLPLSSLTLSMYGGDGLDEEKEQTEMSLGDSKSQPLLNWMSHGSWMNSPPGGPLAEALCLGIASNSKFHSDPASPRACSSRNTISKSSSEESSHGLNF